ncbi:uncharacterized protein LOC142223614 [Haematobia irritans]|uniref:uncharacterized protein LOC142223614 n=1 Tax=Haematobia irritans TaxID=7368 RepID=UPI003F5060FA
MNRVKLILIVKLWLAVIPNSLSSRDLNPDEYETHDDYEFDMNYIDFYNYCEVEGCLQVEAEDGRIIQIVRSKPSLFVYDWNHSFEDGEEYKTDDINDYYYDDGRADYEISYYDDCKCADYADCCHYDLPEEEDRDIKKKRKKTNGKIKKQFQKFMNRRSIALRKLRQQFLRPKNLLPVVRAVKNSGRAALKHITMLRPAPLKGLTLFKGTKSWRLAMREIARRILKNILPKVLWKVGRSILFKLLPIFVGILVPYLSLVLPVIMTAIDIAFTIYDAVEFGKAMAEKQ